MRFQFESFGELGFRAGGGGGDYLVSIVSRCVCRKVKEMGHFSN